MFSALFPLSLRRFVLNSRSNDLCCLAQGSTARALGAWWGFVWICSKKECNMIWETFQIGIRATHHKSPQNFSSRAQFSNFGFFFSFVNTPGEHKKNRPWLASMLIFAQ
jgi:hypothetical protein